MVSVFSLFLFYILHEIVLFNIYNDVHNVYDFVWYIPDIVQVFIKFIEHKVGKSRGTYAYVDVHREYLLFSL